MDIKGVREAMLELTKYYFQNATVIHGRQSHVAKQGKPLVTLYTGTVTRPLNPPTKIIDGRPVSFYPSSVPVQIDLFTVGQKKELAQGFTPVMENTAADDMLSFVGFLNSELAVHFCRQRDIAIVVPNTVQDLTGLINDTAYEYRAMIEVIVYFTSVAIGYSGTLSIDSVKHVDESGEVVSGGDIQAEGATLTPELVVTPSGGGNKEVLADEESYFTNVEINEKLVKEENNNEF